MAAALPASALAQSGPPAGASAGPPSGPPSRPDDEAPKRGVQRMTPGADTGVTLFAPLQSKTTYLVDAAGKTLHEWPSEYTPGNSAYLLDDGSILRCAKDAGESPYRGGGEGGRIQRIAPDGTLLWDFAMANDTWRQHHDIAPMANGHVLAIIWEGVGQKNAMRAGRDASQVGENGLWPDAVVELAPKGMHGAEVVWEWHSWDHLVQDRNAEFPHFGSPLEHARRVDVNYDVLERPKSAEELAKEDEVAERLRGLGYGGGDDDEPQRGEREPRKDWMHTNSIDYDPVHDLIAISVRQASEVWIIDHSTTTAEARTGSGGRFGHGGDLLYRFGNPSTYDADAPQQLFSQHDARFVHVGDALHMTVFNNGSKRPGGDRSSVDEYRLPFVAATGFRFREDGQPALAERVWTWDGGETKHYNGHISGAQRLANGSTLMCLGEDGRTLEISAAGEILWDWLQPMGGNFDGERGPGRDGRGGRPDGPPPEGDRPRGDGPPERGEGRPERGDGPRGQRPGPGGRDRGGRGGGGGRGPRSEHAVFRVTRYPAQHPGVSRLLD